MRRSAQCSGCLLYTSHMENPDDILIGAVIQSVDKQLVLMDELLQQVGNDLNVLFASIALLIKDVDARFRPFPQHRLLVDEHLEDRLRDPQRQRRDQDVYKRQAHR